MPPTRARRSDPDHTRRNLLAAALTTLNAQGYAGATARAIAATAGCNQASIYYHFGGITELLTAALLDSNERRFEQYRQALEPLDDIGEILATWQRLHADDVRSGHITAMTELVGAIGSEPALRSGVATVLHRWIELISTTIRRAVAGTPLERAVPVDEAAHALLALFLGVELIAHMDGDAERVDRLFTAGRGLAGLAPMLLAGPPAVPLDR